MSAPVTRPTKPAKPTRPVRQHRPKGQKGQICQNCQNGQGRQNGRIGATGESTAPEATETGLEALADAALRFRRWTPTITAWGRRLAGVLDGGGRLLVCGNGGSAAEAQHLTAELVGKFDRDRRPLAAIPLHGDSSSTTAIGNDYGADDVFARQVRAHGRAGDVLICLSTSGRSANVIAAATAARQARVTAWALTGPDGGPLAAACDDTIQVDAAATSTVQEIHLAAIHLLCRTIDETLGVPT